VKTLKVPRKSLGRRASSIPALLILGTLSSTALAATDIEAPCPQATQSSDVLDAFIERDATTPVARTIDATETISSRPIDSSGNEKSVAESEDLTSTDESDPIERPISEYTSRLPGVAVNDMPGFRRHMYRTDI
jgi:hypothetical protein